ncbi:MAG: 3'-5' exoribonuclease [Bacteroidales bacterium]|nr:3'-5' exoribonuclease [Bacteroidales bacterium]
MQNFAAIDFEAANGKRTSICSIGLVIVRNGEIVDTFYSLVKPLPNYYHFYNSKIIKLGFKDTKDAPTFPEVWKKAAEKIGDLPLVAHDKMFEEGALKAVFRAYHLKYPNYKFYCTLIASQQKLPTEVENHRLPTVAAYCGYDLTKHHHALADAEACAAIAIKLIDEE